MRKLALILAVLASLVGTALVVLPATAMAGGSEVCTSGECKFTPATWVPGVSVSTSAGSHSESTSESWSFSLKKAKKVLKTWNRTHKRRIVVRQKKNGIKGSRGCMDPEKQGLIKAGDLFWNTDHGVPFLDVWEAGWKICHYRVVTIHGKKYLKGTKKNCGNEGIKIPLHFKVKVKYKVIPSREVKTYKVFWFKIWVKSHSRSHSESGSEAGSTATTEGHYTCPAGWDLVGNNTCKKCPPPHCVPVPPPHECPSGSIWSETYGECVKDGSTTPSPPTEAPGPNPPPSGGAGDPGSNMCYDETTGQPVAPREGLCPPGSYGG